MLGSELPDVCHPDGMRVTIRVKPGASRTKVGGSYNGALTVTVTAPPIDGRATKAAMEAIAEALGCRTREVTLVTGATSRTKIFEVPDGLEEIVARLRAEEFETTR